MLGAVGSDLFPGNIEVAETIGIDAPKPYPPKRANRIAAAVAEHWDSFTLLVVHTDGAGAPDEARQSSIAPGIELAQQSFPDLISIPCVPVREIEAWMLADGEAFQPLLGRGASLSLPPDPEAEADPKLSLRRVLEQGGWRRGSERIHRLFGEEVRLDALRTLPAFRRFEADLTAAIQTIAHAEGY